MPQLPGLEGSAVIQYVGMVGDKAWNQWNHVTSAKPWNVCRKTVEVTREIGAFLPRFIPTLPPTSSRVILMNMWYILPPYRWVCCSLTSGSLSKSSLESFAQRKLTFSSRLYVQATRRKCAKPKNVKRAAPVEILKPHPSRKK
jgi:hypothetical protein